MKNQKNDTSKEELKEIDEGFNARNQYSGSGDFSSDDQNQKGLESSVNSDEPASTTDLEQDESGILKSNN